MTHALFLAGYLALVTASNVLLKFASGAVAPWPFLPYFAGGNAAGFLAILCYTALLRSWPLHAAFPVTRGLAMLGIAGAAILVFGERFRPTEAAGAVLVLAGIAVIGLGRRAAPGDAEAAR